MVDEGGEQLHLHSCGDGPLWQMGGVGFCLANATMMVPSESLLSFSSFAPLTVPVLDPLVETGYRSENQQNVLLS